MNAARVQKVLVACLMGYALFLPVTIALSQPLSFVLAPVVVWLYLQRSSDRPRPSNPLVWPVLVFAMLAAVSMVWSLRPWQTLDKLDRMAMLAVIVAVPWLVVDSDGGIRPERLWRLAGLFVAGASLQAAYDVVHIPWSYHQAMTHYETLASAGQWPGRTPKPTIFDMGNMRDPQMYMVALSLVMGWLLYRRTNVHRGWWWTAAVLNSAAFILHFKRGAWLAFLLSAVVLALLTRHRRLVAILLLAVVTCGALPQVRERLSLLQEELRMRTGGRYALWTEIAPRMMEQYPWGIGWKAGRHEDFLHYGVRIQPKLNHLHNNALQLRLELGWPGVLSWLAWMGTGFWMMARNLRHAGEPGRGLAYGLVGGYLALHLNGLVEYNFGDAEIFMLFNLLLGLAAAMGWQHRLSPDGAAIPGPRGGS